MNASVEIYVDGSLYRVKAFRSIDDAKMYHSFMERLGFFTLLVY